ncbi:PREDICTED: uncharacterized protein LOC104819148 isoform X2 [Tarenaya hassleriana]|uniref:uncharacterized protein LOC104819148 isoform X2 n=1 Tax=Tarenaya hassleriana TaxID=28532 RepID=UPI00053C17C1|nr:PREDICTED: uncharacterized protein LOC104819148 isoform X2 [Tarenaya hassleriana]
MPPESLPWDRKDDFREKKHERPESFGSNPRWRNSSAASYSPHYGSRDFPRWGSPDFRRPPYSGKQGSWEQFEETSSHGCAASRSGGRTFGNVTYQSSVSRGDFRHCRNIRDNRGSFVQRDWKPHAWVANNGATNAFGRPFDMITDQRLAENIPPCPASQSDTMKTWDQFRDKQDNKVSGNNGLNAGQKCELETSLSSVDWKPLKWTRSGSLCSRSSGFSNSSSSKSLGAVDSSEMKDENLRSSATLLQSPPGNATPCVASAVSSDEAISRKKPRLGWGEGLAKYEKRKVDGPDVNVQKDGPTLSTNSSEAAPSLVSSLVDKSPRILGFTDCASPATPSSIACSSSPSADDNLYRKAANANSEPNNMSGLPSLGVWNQLEGFSFNLENLDDVSMANLSSSLNWLLHLADPGSVDCCFASSTAMSRLLFWKGDVLKTLEVAESEIDLLENELKRIKSESGDFSLCPASSSSLAVDVNTNLSKELEAVSTFILRPAPLQLTCSADEVVDKTPTGCSGLEEHPANGKAEDLDSPGTATSKLLEPLSLANSLLVSKFEFFVEDSGNSIKNQSQDLLLSCNESCLAGNDDVNAPLNSENIELASGGSRSDDGDDIQCKNIMLCNKESARQASEVLIKLLPGDFRSDNALDLSDIVGSPDSVLVRQRITARRRMMRFKEKVLAIKFKAFLNAWRKDMHQLSMRRCRPRSQKKVDSGLRMINGGYTKNRTHSRSRLSSPGNLCQISFPEMVSLTSEILSNSPQRPYRNVLKMPEIILEDKEKIFSRFISTNGLIEDPCAVEKERARMNPWTKEEEEIFVEKFATYGKDFRRIASFLDHKTTADCIEFYYKNHKSDCFKKIKKCGNNKQEKCAANTYLVTSSKKWNRDTNAVSLNILGAVSAMAAHADCKTASGSRFSVRITSGKRIESKMSQADDCIERSSSFDLPEKESFAADILAGFCGSLSSEAMSSCITSCVDPGEICRDWKFQRMDSSRKRCSVSDITQTANDDTCSDDSCGETDSGDWTDEERSLFMHALSLYGKDFASISRCIRTKSREKCRIFFSKARKRLGLDSILLPRNVGSSVSDDADGDGSDSEDACVLGTSSAICNDVVDAKRDEDLSGSPFKINQDACLLGPVKLETDLNMSEVEDVRGILDRSIHLDTFGVDDKHQGHHGVANESVNGNCVKIQAQPDQQAQEDTVLSTDAEKSMDSASQYHASSCAVASFAPCSSLSDELPASDIVKVTMETRKEDSVLDKSVMSITNLNEDACGKHDGRNFVQDSLVNNANATNNQEADTSSFSGFNNFDCQPQVSVQRRLHIPSLQEQATISVKLESPGHAILAALDKPGNDVSLTTNVEKAKPDHEFVGRCHHLQNVAAPHVPTSHILSDHALRISTKKEMDSDVYWGQVREVQMNLKSDAGIGNECVAQGFSLRKCNGLINEQKVLSLEQKSGTDKSCKNGDVKLFGKILTPHENEGKGLGLDSKQSGKPPTLNFAVQKSADGQPANVGRDKVDYSGHENVPIRSYGFWDGTRIQTGLSSLPDSAILLAKYPAAFANYSASSSAKEQQEP